MVEDQLALLAELGGGNDKRVDRVHLARRLHVVPLLDGGIDDPRQRLCLPGNHDITSNGAPAAPSART